MKLLENIAVHAAFASEPHKRALQKPNEDRLLCDPENGIFIVLDGVTRVHAEYEQHPYDSSAADVADLFIEAVHCAILQDLRNPRWDLLLKNAIHEANGVLHTYRAKQSEDKWVFYPAATGIVSLIRNNTLYYAAAGDCLGILLRGNAKQLFGCQWQLEAVDKLMVTKQERYSRYCNHPESPLSYTVFNGDDGVADAVTYSYLDLHPADTLILASDGLSDYLKYEPASILREQTPQQMIDCSEKYDKPPFADYADDKALIKLQL